MSFYISRKLSFASARLFIFDYKLFIVNYQSNMKIKQEFAMPCRETICSLTDIRFLFICYIKMPNSGEFSKLYPKTA